MRNSIVTTKENDEKWRMLLLQSQLGIIFMILAVEILVMVIYNYLNLLDISLFGYFIKYMAAPTGINLMSWLAADLLNKSRSLSSGAKNLTVCMQLFTICVVVECIHHEFPMLLCAPCIAIFISIVFTDVRIAYLQYVLSMMSAALAEWMEYISGNASVDKCIVNFIIAFFLTIAVMIIINQTGARQREQIAIITEGQDRLERLMKDMRIEPVTGLYNRKAYEDSVRIKVENVKRRMADGESSVVMPVMAILDIDLFKRINDTYGHLTGDRVLLELSDIIRRNVSGIASAYRYGGEEFVILFEKQWVAEAIYLVENIRNEIAGVRFDFDANIVVTVSAGISRYKAGMTENNWFDSADKALYEAKATGRNRIVVNR